MPMLQALSACSASLTADIDLMMRTWRAAIRSVGRVVRVANHRYAC